MTAIIRKSRAKPYDGRRRRSVHVRPRVEICIVVTIGQVAIAVDHAHRFVAVAFGHQVAHVTDPY